MGTDIHPRVEVRTPEGWRVLGDHPEALEERNYVLFAILANVRNGTGFAGVVTGAPVPYIAEPRGVPDDLAPVNQDAIDGARHRLEQLHCRIGHAGAVDEDEVAYLAADLGDHSHSWVTLGELKAYDWANERESYGVIDVEAYRAWHPADGPPESYCGDIAGRGIVVVDDEDWPPDAPIPGSHVRVAWREPLATRCASFYDEVLPWLEAQRAAHGVGDDDLRLVFGFDS